MPDPGFSHLNAGEGFLKPAEDHPAQVAVEHHRADDDGMPQAKRAERAVESPLNPNGQEQMSLSAEQTEAYRHRHDELMSSILKQGPGNVQRLSAQEAMAMATDGWDLREFQRRNIARSQSPMGFDHHIMDWSLNDWLVALGGEVGEAMNVAKKMLREQTRTRGNRKGETYEALRRKLADELADAFIYLLLTAARMELDVPTIVEAKFAEASREIGYYYGGAPSRG